MGLSNANTGTLILWATYLMLILLGLFVRKSKCYDACFVVFMGVVAWLNTDSADILDVYMPMYAAPQLDWGTEQGWLFLCKVGNALCLSYNGFVFFLSLFASTALVIFARKTTPNESFYLALFLVYPGLLSLVQFRQFIATAIALIGVLVLASGRRGKWVWFFLLLLVAFSMHRSAIILVLLAIVPIYRRVPKKLRWLATAFGAFLLVEAVINAQSISTFIFGEVKTGAYFRSLSGDASAGSAGNASSLGIALIDIFLTVFLCVLVPFFAKRLQEDAVEDSAFLKFASFANIATIVLVPMLFITEDFMRFERYGFMLALCIFAGMPYLAKRHVLFSCKAFLLAICFAFCWMYAIRGTTFGAVIGPLLSFEHFPSLFL